MTEFRFSEPIYYLYQHLRLDEQVVFYVGIGRKNTKTRFQISRYHRGYSKKGRNNHWKRITQSSNYEVEIILETKYLDEVKFQETQFIAKYGRRDLRQGELVNMTSGGDGRFNTVYSDEERERRRVIRLGAKHSDETKQKISVGNKGKIVSQETRSKLSKANAGQLAWNKGVPMSNDDKIKNRISQPNLKSILQLTLTGELIRGWCSIREAEKELGIDRSVIIKCCKGRQHTAGGFKWRYK